MALRTRIEPIARDIELFISEMLSPQAQSEAVASYAKDVIAEADDINRQILGRLPPKTITVDGRAGAPLASVKPDGGVIIAEWDIVTDVLIWIAKTLVERSPRVSGDYIKGHTLFADGVETKVGTNIPAAEEYSFTNMVPYARKIEIGITEAGRSFVVQVPNRIYERTGKDARARFGNIAKIQFTYRGIVGGYQIKAGTAGRAHNRSEVRYPTIVVRPN